MTKTISNDTINVFELVQKMVDHIKSPTEEGVIYFNESLSDIENALLELKSYKRKQPKPVDNSDDKRPRGRPRVPHRAILENGKYDSRTIDPDYQKRYYLEKLKDVKIPCTACGVNMFKVNITRHMKSSKCKCKAQEHIHDSDSV